MHSRQHRQHVFAALSALVAALVCVGAAPAQAPPRTPGSDITSATTTLNAQQDKLLADFVTYHVQRLASGDPVQVQDARATLTQPLRSSPSQVFLFHYAKTLVPALEQLIDKPDEPGKSNAFAVKNATLLLQLNSKRALDALARRLGDPRLHVRISASSAMETLVAAAAGGGGEIQPRDLEAAAEQIHRAIASEDNGVVMRHLFQALARINTADTRRLHIQAMAEVAKRLAAQPTNHAGIMDAMRSAALYWRGEYPALPEGEGRAIAAELAPVLGSLCEVARAHWDDAHNDARAKEIYGGTIQLSESVLKLIENQKGPQTALRQWWDQLDKPKYEAELQLWMEVLSKPPYQ